MTKLYAICLDAFPEVPKLKEYLTQQGLIRSTLVCASAFTCGTMTSMISGNLPSEIIPSSKGDSVVNKTTGLVQNRTKFTGGIGYNTSYHKQFYEWRCSSQCIIDRVDTCIIHNHINWMNNILCGKQLTEAEKTKHYRDRKTTPDISASNTNVYDFGIIQTHSKIKLSSTNPDLTLNTFVRWNSPTDMKKFYSNELQYIKFIQKFKFNGLFWTDLCHWHEHVYYPNGQDPTLKEKITATDAIDHTLKWLENWDWSEPDSVFYIYADHSHRVDPHLDPPGYMTWVYFKDNRKTDSKLKLSPFVSSIDFYSLTEKIFQLEPAKRSKWSQSPDEISSYKKKNFCMRRQ